MESGGSPRGRLDGRIQQKRAGVEAEAASAVPGSRRGVNKKEGTSLCGEREKEESKERQRSQEPDGASAGLSVGKSNQTAARLTAARLTAAGDLFQRKAAEEV